MKKYLAMILALVMALSLVACGDKKDDSADNSDGDTASGRVYWLNFKPEADGTLQKVAAMYTEKTGVPVTVVTAASGTYNETLTAEMDKSAPPTLFVVGNQAAVDTWGDYCSYTNSYGTLPPESYSSVSIADEQEAYRAVSELYQNGHRRIAVLTAAPDDSSISQLRYLGYQRALRDFGLTEHPEDLICAEDFTIANAYAAMQKRLRSPADFTAVFAIADDMAIGAMRALRESGRSIPEDCSVIAIDGISVSEYIHPMLTTLCQPMTAMGKASVEILLDIIEGRGVHRHVTLPTALREGASVRQLKH